MKKYLTTLIEEKGAELDDTIKIDGHFGLTWSVLVDFIDNQPASQHADIKAMLVKIDFHNGDIFNFLTYLAKSMLKAQGYDIEL